MDGISSLISWTYLQDGPLWHPGLESNQCQPPAVARLASIQISMTVMSLGMSGLQSVHVRA